MTLKLTSVLGGVLGVSCSHNYVGTSNSTQSRMPDALRGVDLMRYLVFKALGLAVRAVPIIEVANTYGGTSIEDMRHGQRSLCESAYKKLQRYQEQRAKDIHLEYEGEKSATRHICRLPSQDIQRGYQPRLNQLNRLRRVNGLPMTPTHPVIFGLRFEELRFPDTGLDLDGDCDIDKVGSRLSFNRNILNDWPDPRQTC